MYWRKLVILIHRRSKHLRVWRMLATVQCLCIGGQETTEQRDSQHTSKQKSEMGDEMRLRTETWEQQLG
jgi:hypothetical protein